MGNATINLRGNFTIGRMPFFMTGVVLGTIKYALDNQIASRGFGRYWSPWDYIVSGATFSQLAQASSDRRFFITLLAVSLPFIVVGVALTLARLRSAGASCLLVFMFFLPVFNVILFIILSLIPPKSQAKSNAPVGPLPLLPTGNSPPGMLPYGTGNPDAATRWITRIFPEDTAKSLAISVSITVVIVLAMTFLSVEVFASYGLGVFVALPFCSGLISAVLHGLRSRRSFAQCTLAALLTTIIAASFVFLVGIEGLVCLLMFLPLAIPIAMLGAAVGYALQSSPIRSHGAAEMIAALIVFLPLFMGAEHVAHPSAPVYEVTTSVDINAPPQLVWNNVIAFSEITDRPDLLFRAGVAYPIRAQINGHGPGAIRECIFSTGAFVEPITVWDEPQLLKFDVTSNPAAMREWSPYNIHPPHIHDFMISHAGQFRLIPLAGNRTRLEGDTWYEHNLWPASYWRLWSDFIIHKIHLRVLTHIQNTSEGQAVASR